MRATPDSTLANPERRIADLERQLAECRAERDEALARETATAEVLHVINSSPGDLAPVFDAILEKAHTLCGATHGGLNIYDGERFRNVAAHAIPQRFVELMRQPFHARPIQQRLLRGERYVHVSDMMARAREDPDDPIGRASDEAGIRTLLVVPLRKDGALLGYITAHREEVRPFSDKQIALLENFAAQAVIAMENARLLTETGEALEQQTATAEVLGVINSSSGDLGPVFDAILDKAHSLCGAEHGSLFTYDGELFWRVATQRPPPAQYSELVRDGFRPGPGNPFVGVLERERLVHIADIRQGAGEQPDDPGLRVALEVGLRTFLIVPLRKDKLLLGVITAVRHEVRPFSDKQIALLENFAAQAVIAMENARLITETREALEQQTATAEMLGVINSSPGDLAPVFDAILEKAMRLCGAAFGILNTYERETFHHAATRGVPPAYDEWRRRTEMSGPGTGHARVIAGEDIVHSLDLMAERPYRDGDPYRRAFVELAGARTGLIVALRKERVLLGVIRIFRQEVRPFSDKQIALLQNFAAQAVIAMENARLLDELRQRTDQVAELNRGLEARVAEQVEELGRVGRLKRFLAPQLAELIVSCPHPEWGGSTR